MNLSAGKRTKSEQEMREIARENMYSAFRDIELFAAASNAVNAVECLFFFAIP